MINVNFNIVNGKHFTLNAFDDMPTNEFFKLFMKRFDISKNEMDKLHFLYHGSKIDIESVMTLEENKINNYDIILVVDDENILLSEFFEVLEVQKNKCIIHNNKSNLFCNQCKMEICEKCLNNHWSHPVENLEIKNEYLKNDFEKFETFITNSEKQ